MTEPRTPGQWLQDLLDERGWTQSVLELVTEVDQTVISKIINGKKAVDARLALIFGEVFGVPADRFLTLQQSFDLAQARLVERPDPARARRAQLYAGLPIAEMIKRGWLRAKDLRDVATVESELARFFRAASVDDIPVLSPAFKKTDPASPINAAQLAWLYRVDQIASEMVIPRYSASSLRVALLELRDLLSAPELARHVPRILTACGVRFLIVETIGNAKVDGVCCWASTGDAPVVALSCRFDRIDNFWFVLRHELEHVLREDGRVNPMLDVELEGKRAGADAEIPAAERLANEAAADFCAPADKIRKFIAVKSPLFPERDMIGLARTLRVHPGLVAGQLRHKTGRFELFQKHLVKIRSAVTSSALVDGWGDVVPVAM
jgi:HTH-type transcriptional regulator / antitoxin HigA